ncbi:MAG TPA: Hpt domain-containing protein [Blastocatellia bacterium]|nr:Hpt domain-containing protein [Blastocatellia bacterium]
MSNLFRAELLTSLGGDLELLREMVELFLSEVPDQMVRIQSAVSAGSSAELLEAAHSFKGSVSNYTNGPAYEAARTLEFMGRSGDLSNAAQMVLRLEDEIARLRAAMQDYLNEARGRQV